MPYAFNENKSKYSIDNRVVLWKNPNPSDAFPSQTITVNGNIQNEYDYLEVIYLMSVSPTFDRKYGSAIIYTDKLTPVMIETTYNTTDNTFFEQRRLTFNVENDYTRINFSIGASRRINDVSHQSLATANTPIIPIAIIGHNL